MSPDERPRSGMKAPEAAAILLRDPVVARIFAALDRDGDETRIVGGALRNALFGRPVHEIDLATTAPPDVITARADASGLRCIPTGIEHGTVTLLADGRTFEVTSLREDVETDGRRAKVRFGRDFETDALRRDFTMNALSMSEGGDLFDYVGGLKDIAAKKLRFIGEPARRIREDYLRILRFFRFSADFGEGPLDPAGLVASMRERDGLASLSRERVRTELLKLFAARRAGEVTQDMSDAGLLGPLLAAAPNPTRLRRAAAIDLAAPLDPLLALAALCLETREDAERLRERLRLSNAEFHRLERAAIVRLGLHGREDPPTQNDLRVLLFRHGRQAALDALTLAQAEARAPVDAQWQCARAFLRDAPEPRLPYSGGDLLARGVPAGRAIGEALKDLQDRWIGAGFPEDPASVARLLDETLGPAK
ncbi:CCA tRNA nucleotidyltransferase [Methylocapsa aurea]|uniref:CCA tRNA nucleotidyltransferase n=1 Tax=Methylocapsa aurea TaxID=663610 RepID=UPI00068F2E79|nr:CCA tRNA nucleotidyltransferase [Methylocapsa aurea]